MARRVPLPRLTHRQRTSRRQRERRQQAIVVTAFTAVLVFVLGLAAWAASDRYYNENLSPAATVDGLAIPQREFARRSEFEYVRLYVDYGVPPGFENDQQVAAIKVGYRETALERVVEQRILDVEADAAGIAPTAAEVEDIYQGQYGEANVRHILVAVAPDAADKEAAEATAKAKARAIADQLRSAPDDQALWNRIAEDSSDDPGSKFSGGDLGFAGKGKYVPEFEDAIRALSVGQISDPVRTQFGFHVLQLRGKKDAAETDLVRRYLSYGFTAADLKEEARYEAIRKEMGSRAKDTALVSPTQQVHLARIVINIPPPAGGDFQRFTEALKKQSDARTALDQGKDFAELAKEVSEDTETKDKGGDMGWVAKGMITDLRAEELVFSAEMGQVTEPVSTTSTWTVYKVLEKEPSRELTDEQRQTISTNAYQYWLEQQKKAHDVQKLIAGLGLE